MRFGSTTLPSGAFFRAACEAAQHGLPCDSRRCDRHRGAGGRARGANPRAAAPMNSGAFARSLQPPAKSRRATWGAKTLPNGRSRALAACLPSMRPAEERSASRVEHADRSALTSSASAPAARDGDFARGEVQELVDDGHDEPPPSSRSRAVRLLKKARVKRARLIAAERQQREAAAAAQRECRDALALVDAQRAVHLEKAMTPLSLLPPSAACLLPSAWG